MNILHRTKYKMTSTALGKLPEFADWDNWQEFIERLDAYFTATGITGDDSDMC